MNIPCKIHVNCPPAPGSLEFDSPLANFSSEAPDQDLFIGINYGWDVNVPNLGWSWNNNTGIGVCESPVSQAVADQCAQNNQLTNLTGGGGEFPNDGWLTQTGNPVTPVFNQQQAASFVCPDGLLFTWIVAAGTLNALNQAVANAIAFNQAVQNANAHYICLGSLTNTATVGTAYSSIASTTRGPQVKAPLSIGVIAGTLPPGLVGSQSADSFSFILSGTPTTPGTFNFTLQATDPTGNFMQKQYTITVQGNCVSVFAHPSWNITFTTPPNPPGSNASASASGPNFSLFSSSDGVTIPSSPIVDFGVTGPELPYTLGIALSCKLTVSATVSGNENSDAIINARLQDNSLVQILNTGAFPGGTSVFSFTIPANCKSLQFQVSVVGGNGVGAAGSINISGSFGS